MTKEELIKRLETTCLGLDPIDPLRLLVDDVIEALAQTERTWVGLDHQDKKKFSLWLDYKSDDEVFTAIEAKLKELNT
jgi:hypothetical protein